MFEKNYRGFTLIDETPIEDFNSTGIWLCHDKTGMQVFHLKNDDPENLFAFAFETLPEDSTGVTHIIEHSVLCGSKNYPLKDPFLQLCTQSVKTFLNAWTFPDKTVYPASSMVESDYFNLMAVYGDAVFFPKLDEKIFKQEGHRIEIDEDGNKSIQGVVYNEMKGALSSADRLTQSYALRSLLKCTPYIFESGGNPDEIPNLTYEQFKKYHAEHYTPGKCRLFLYGNIPTEKQLDFIIEHFLSNENFSSETFNVSNVVFPPPRPIIKPESYEFPIPTNNETSVLVNWYLGDSTDIELYMECAFFSELLLGHDGSPLTKALLQSGLGQDISPSSGFESEMRYTTFSIGLRGIERKNALAVENLVLDTLNDLCTKEISADEIEAAVRSVDFANREVCRANGPYSLVLLRRCLRGWLYGKSPAQTLSNRKAFAIIRKKIQTGGSKWIQSEIRRLFLNNTYRTRITVYPDECVATEHEKIELLNINKGLKLTDEDTIKKEMKILKDFQNKKEDESVRSLIPHLKPSDLEPKIDKVELTETKIVNVPFFTVKEAVNGIVYVDFRLPVDVLEPEDYRYLPFFSVALTNVGFAGMDWVNAAAKVASLTGSFGASLFNSSVNPERNIPFENLYEYDPVMGRFWLKIRMKMLEELTEPAIKMLFDCINSPDFSDAKRMKDLAVEMKNDFVESIVPMGSEYTASRASCKFSRSLAVDEIWTGLSIKKTVMELNQLSGEEIGSKMTSLYKKLIGHGAIVQIVGEESGLEIATKAIEPFLINYPILSKPLKIDDSRFFELTNQTGNFIQSDSTTSQDSALEVFTTETRTGFSTMSFPCSPYGTTESVYETIAAHWISDAQLWEKIRTNGGAYGAWMQIDSVEKLCSITSYRDPSPEKSVKVFSECLKTAAETDLTQKDFERILTGAYSKEVQPRAPSVRASIALTRRLYGITDEDREIKIKTLLSAKPTDLTKSAQRLLTNITNEKRAIICSKNVKTTGIFVDLDL